MPVFVDPKSGERFENVPDDAVEQARGTYGLVPEEEYAAQQAEEQKPFLQKTGEGVMALSEGMLRPIEALANRFGPTGRQKEMGQRLAGTWSPSDEAARQRSAVHPVYAGAGTALSEAPLMAIGGGVPGAVARVGAGALLGASESAFQQGREYGDYTPEELAKMAAIGGAVEAAVPGMRALRNLAQGARAGGREVAREAGLLAQEVVKQAPGIGKMGQGAVSRAVEGAISSATVGLGSAIGGPLGAAVGAAAGRAANKLVGKQLSERIWTTASRAAQAGAAEAVNPGLMAAAALGKREGAEALAGAVGTNLAASRMVNAATGEVLGQGLKSETVEWFAKHANETAGETVQAALKEATQSGAARAEVAAANKSMTESMAKAVEEKLDALAGMTPQEKVQAIQASGVKLGGSAKAQRDALGRTIDALADGLGQIDPASSRAFSEMARQQLATARTAAERYRIGMAMVETLADQTARAGNTPMAKVMGAYAEQMWETMGRAELWMSPRQLAALGKRVGKAPKLIPSLKAGEDVAEAVARGDRAVANDVATKAPVDPEAVAVGTGFSPAFSKAGRAGEAWKGSERQAASIDARIAAYGEKPEFLDLVREKAAESRRTPFGPGKERELWELQKDVLEENEALFPRIAGESRPTAIRSANPADDIPVAEMVGDRGTKYSLAGKSLDDLKALPIEGADDAARVESLMRDPGFSRTGRVASNDAAHGITVVDDAGELVLRDGRHRLTAAQKLDLPSVQGRVVDGASGKTLYEGAIPLKAARRGGQRGAATVGAMGAGAAAAGGLAGANVLARARRRADESVGVEDLDGLSAEDRAAAVRSNGARYQAEVQGRIADGLEASGARLEKARGALVDRIGELASEPSDAQRQFAASQLMGIGAAEQSLREMGHDDAARALEPVIEALTELEVAHEQRLPVQHDAGELLGQLAAAHDALRQHAGELPPESAEALESLTEGLGRGDLWGDAGQAWQDLSAARGADLGADPGNPEAVQAYLEAARGLLDAAERWGVETDALRSQLSEVDGALAAGETLSREMGALGSAEPGDSDVVDAALAEAGGGDRDAVLSQMGEGLTEMLAASTRVSAYDDTLRAIQRGSEVATRRAARAAAGAGLSTAEVDPDRTTAEFAAGFSDELAAFDARRDTLERIMQDPQLLADSLAESYGHLADTHPEVFSDLVATATRAAEVLGEAMPPSVAVSLTSPNGLPPSVDDVRAFARVYVSVTEPSSYLRDLGSGQAWPEQSQAFAKVYPTQWQRLSEVAVTTAKERGMSLTPQEASYLDLTFGIGNVIGGLWSDSGSQAIRDATAASQQKRQRARSGTKAGQPAASPTSATASLAGGPSSLPVS